MTGLEHELYNLASTSVPQTESQDAVSQLLDPGSTDRVSKSAGAIC